MKSNNGALGCKRQRPSSSTSDSRLVSSPRRKSVSASSVSVAASCTSTSTSTSSDRGSRKSPCTCVTRPVIPGHRSGNVPGAEQERLV